MPSSPHRSRPGRVLSAIVALATLLVGVAGADVVERDFHESFDVSKGMRLHLHHGDGAVEIIRWEKDVVDVDVTYRSDNTTVGIGREPEFHVDFRATDSRIEVKERFEGARVNVGIHIQRDLEYTYTIHAPDYVELHLEGDDGDVQVEDWRASISCRNDDGEISLSRIRANVEVRFQDGRVELSDVEGDLDVDADDGDLYIEGAKARDIRVRCNDGRIEIRDSEGALTVTTDDGDLRVDALTTSHVQARGGDGNLDVHLIPGHDRVDYDIETDDGTIDLILEGEVSARLTVRTDDGRIDADVRDVEVVEDERDRFEARLGDGDGRIDIRAGDGRVRVRDR